MTESQSKGQTQGLPKLQVDAGHLRAELAADKNRVIQKIGMIGPQTETALSTWKEKLEYLQQQEAITADPAQKFALKKQIQEAQQKIRDLGGTA